MKTGWTKAVRIQRKNVRCEKRLMDRLKERGKDLAVREMHWECVWSYVCSD